MPRLLKVSMWVLPFYQSVNHAVFHSCFLPSVELSKGVEGRDELRFFVAMTDMGYFSESGGGNLGFYSFNNYTSGRNSSGRILTTTATSKQEKPHLLDFWPLIHCEKLKNIGKKDGNPNCSKWTWMLWSTSRSQYIEDTPNYLWWWHSNLGVMQNVPLTTISPPAALSTHGLFPLFLMFWFEKHILWIDNELSFNIWACRTDSQNKWPIAECMLCK